MDGMLDFYEESDDGNGGTISTQADLVLSLFGHIPPPHLAHLAQRESSESKSDSNERDDSGDDSSDDTDSKERDGRVFVCSCARVAVRAHTLRLVKCMNRNAHNIAYT